ncbi:MAG: allantoinase AllB [Acidobacteriota bacterium]
MTAVASEFVVRSRRVVVDEQTRPAAVHIRSGTVVGVTDFEDVPGGCPIDEAGDAVVMPGVVDTHVHVNEPGRTGWEGFDTATRAAAAGGVTTIVDMPLNSIPATTSAAALEAKRRAAEGQCFVDVGFWGGVVPGNASELPGLAAAGALGFKCFLVPSGVDEFEAVTEADLRIALPVLARLGVPLLVHAELPGPIEKASRQLAAPIAGASGDAPDPRRYATYLATRPTQAENDAIALSIALCREYGVRTHIVHLSSAAALPLLIDAFASHCPITVETCPHYLTFAAGDIADGATAFKCAPPIRERENRESLWAALAGGRIQMVASDHSPSPPALKQLGSGNFLTAWGGISSLQISLAATWTGASARGWSLTQLAGWLCRAPSRLAGLERKGAIEVGRDADLVVWDPEREFTVAGRSLLHRHALTPYEGGVLRGVVERTYLRGQRIYQRGQPMRAPAGRFLTRSG